MPGSGPMSRSSTSGATASGTVAAIRVRRSSGRLTNWLASAPSSKVSAKASRSAGLEAQRFARLGELHLGHQMPDPDRGADPEGEERNRHGEAEREVGVQHCVDRVHLEDHVGGDEAEARQHRDHEAERDDPLGLLGLGRVGRLCWQLTWPLRRAVALARSRAWSWPSRAAACRSRGAAACPHRCRSSRRPASRVVPVVGIPPGRRCHSWAFPCFAVIHRAASTMKSSRPRNATSPSVTGPTRPRLKPPGFGLAAGLGDVRDDVALLGWA